MSWKIVSGTIQFDRYFLFQGIYQVFFKGSCIVLFQKSSRNLNREQYGLTCIVYLVNIGQFLSKARSYQDKMWIESYCPLKDSTYISIENSFLLLEIFFKNFNQRQYRLIHIVHVLNFGQSLSKSHIVRSMLNFAMFVANSDQANV